MGSTSQTLESFDIQPRPLGKVTTSNKLLKVTDSEFLTKKQKIFVEQYLKHGIVRKAAFEAGYAPSVAENAHQTVLKSAVVIREIRRRRSEWLATQERDTDWARGEVAICAGANMGDYGHCDDQGNWQVDLSNCTREQLACIQEISYDVNGRPKIRLVDKKAFLELHLRANGGLDYEAVDEGHDDMGFETFDSIIRKVKQAKSVTINNQYNIVSQQRQSLPETVEAR